MGLLDREYMRETPRVHVGEEHRPRRGVADRSPTWTGTSGPPHTRPHRRHYGGWVVLALLLVLAAIVATAVLTGLVTFTIAH